MQNNRGEKNVGAMKNYRGSEKSFRGEEKL
jgi:hypothetical protein